ncbi:MAG: rRNA maturation RNase YbeY [Planctomycetota bacterium]
MKRQVRVFGTSSRRLRSLLAAAARAAGPLKGPVEIHLVTDNAIRRVNRDRLGHDWATDVCTFPMEERFLWGELVVSVQTAKREARERGISFERELALYVVHGVLHLRGHDDRTDAGRNRMRTAETRCLAKLFKPMA